MFTSTRIFRLWRYCVSHDFLLLRSPKNDVHSTNSDLVFAGVEYMSLPSILRGLVLHDATSVLGSQDYAAQWSKESQLFVIESQGRRYEVVACGLKVYENDLDMMESGFEFG